MSEKPHASALLEAPDRIPALTQRPAAALARLYAFQLKQVFFDMYASRVASQAAIRANDPMTGDDNHDRVAVVGKPYCPEPFGTSDGFCNVFVSAGLSIGDILQGGPVFFLEFCTLGRQGQIKGSPLAGKVFVQLAAYPADEIGFFF